MDIAVVVVRQISVVDSETCVGARWHSMYCIDCCMRIASMRFSIHITPMPKA